VLQPNFRDRSIYKLFQLTDDQLGQMYELMNATKDLWKPADLAADSVPNPDIDRNSDLHRDTR